LRIQQGISPTQKPTKRKIPFHIITRNDGPKEFFNKLLEEQKEVIARMTRLRKPIIVLTAASAVLFLSGVSFWLYEGLKNF
jgi:adenine/guanine phosphoribosyltransferase-like PRPP-binding protein